MPPFIPYGIIEIVHILSTDDTFIQDSQVHYQQGSWPSCNEYQLVKNMLTVLLFSREDLWPH